VRDEYYKIYVVKDDLPKDSENKDHLRQAQDARRQAFYRCVERAQQRNLIGVSITDTGRLIWFATGEYQP
jgi:hypothetical protein